MKKLTSLTPVAAILALTLGNVSTANAEIKLADQLSVTGFIDMSWTYTDPDGGSSEQSFGLDQFELDFLYNFDSKLSAQVDLEYQDNGTGEEVDIEQAFITYGLSDSLSFKAGRFLSYSGWETEEPTGLFQYSGTGYAKYFYGGYQQGVSALYSGDGFAAAVSVVNSLGDLEGEFKDPSSPAIETMIALMPTDDFTIKGFYSVDSIAGSSESVKMMNIWAAYSMGDLTLAAELNDSQNTAGIGTDAAGYLFMANYAFDSAGITLRYHDYEVETTAGAIIDDGSAITISPSLTISDNLLMVFEYRMDSSDTNGDSDSIAVEALVTF
ncbi:porin [Catenovulum maritimum]|uniref:Porin n=1 Tax=Catenovulum maritimum TaxID=1513271 RepID=A0A0J8GSW2_9ALTE|nr:porin [Catenovulum maritimum]KMT64374.1 porin [Catenovulum maritimum]